MIHDYESADDWYEALENIAKSHCNKHAVRDFDGWTEGWQQNTPADAYYEEYPEHKLNAAITPQKQENRP